MTRQGQGNGPPKYIINVADKGMHGKFASLEKIKRCLAKSIKKTGNRCKYSGFPFGASGDTELFCSCFANQIEAQRSGFDLERRSKGAGG